MLRDHGTDGMPLSRRASFLVVALLAAVAVPGGGSPGRLPRALGGESRPNVLFIVTDDQRFDTLSVMPRTRRWFEQGGTSYPNTFATTPLCCPSRASIMSGQYAHNHEVETNVSAPEFDQDHSLQRYLDQEGYQTAVTGKFLNAWQGDPRYFDRWSIFIDPSKYRGAAFNIDGGRRKIDRYSTDFVGSQATGYLNGFEGDDASPWFLYVAPLTPHDPYEPDKEFRRARIPKWRPSPAVGERDRSDKPPWLPPRKQRIFMTPKEAREIRALQLRMLMSADRMVGRIFRTLSALGELNDTLAVFISDNGKHWGEHSLGGKQDPYTHSVRIPMYAMWPGRLAGGAVDQRLTLNVDPAATVFDAVGVQDMDYEVDGRSLLDPGWDRDHIFSENKFGGRAVPSWATIRTATYQYTEYYDEALGETTFREYYDLVSDPYQLTNLLADGDPANDPSNEELSQLSLSIQRDRRCEGSNGPGECP